MKIYIYSFMSICLLLGCSQIRKIQEVYLYTFEFSDFIMEELKSYNRLNDSDAISLKMFSSNGEIAHKKSIDDIIKIHGKIEPVDVFKTYKLDEEKIIVLTKYLGFVKLFLYNKTQKLITKIETNSQVILNDFETIKVYNLKRNVLQIVIENQTLKDDITKRIIKIKI